MNYSARLRDRLAATGAPIRLALVGAGQMGRGFAAQAGRMPGVALSAIADVDVNRAREAYSLLGQANPLLTDDPDVAGQAVLDGRAVIVRGHEMVSALPVDVIVEATGIPDIGARVALGAVLSGKHVAMLNVECDVTVGMLLTRLARRSGVVYTICRGDEPVEAKVLVDYARDLSFEVVCAGKGKNNPLDPTATPASLATAAAAKHMNPKMLCSFVDGSKAMIEMAALANTTGLGVSTRGMHGPASTVETLHQTFALASDGGVLDRPGVVDYCTGPVAPGVFAIIRTDQPYVAAELSYLKMGPGPYYTLYRPFHLASVEAPLSVPEAVLDGRASMAPEVWNAEVAAAAKRDLAPGDLIDGIGGGTVYGVIEDAVAAATHHLVPLGLLAGARLRRAVPQGRLLSYDDVELDESSVIVTLRRLQDQLLGRNAAARADASSLLPAAQALVPGAI